MHIQPLFAERRPDELHRLMRAYPLATLIASAADGVQAHVLPLETLAGGTLGLLRGHVARDHGLLRDASDGAEVLTMFQSPNAYISPRWYVAGQRSGRVAPSWNYVAVQARGRLRFIDDGDWLLVHLAALTAMQEAHRETPWSLADAAPGFAEAMAQRLVGFEIELTELAGKRFLSQQRTEADRHSIVRHLALEPAGSARDVAGLIEP